MNISLNNRKAQEQWVVTWGYKNDGDYRVEFTNRRKAEELYEAISGLNLTYAKLSVEKLYQSVQKIEKTESVFNINYHVSINKNEMDIEGIRSAVNAVVAK